MTKRMGDSQRGMLGVFGRILRGDIEVGVLNRRCEMWVWKCWYRWLQGVLMELRDGGEFV
jgi:hypothetical protein